MLVVFVALLAMHLLQAGVNFVYIRDFLGHKHITTTEIYARADTKAKRIALENAYMKLEPRKDISWNGVSSLRTVFLLFSESFYYVPPVCKKC